MDFANNNSPSAAIIGRLADLIAFDRQLLEEVAHLRAQGLPWKTVAEEIREKIRQHTYDTSRRDEHTA